MCFSKRLGMILRSKNLKQIELCRISGIQSSLMSEYLSGKKGPTFKNAVIIADALEVSLDALAGREGASIQKAEQGSCVLGKLCEEAEDLSEEEQLYLLDMVKSLKQHLRKQ